MESKEFTKGPESSKYPCVWLDDLTYDLGNSIDQSGISLGVDALEF